MQCVTVTVAVWRRRPTERFPQLTSRTTTQPSPIEGEGQRAFDLTHHGEHILVDLIVRKPQHPVALGLDPALALDVTRRHFGDTLMDPAINLDHKPAPVAGEVGDVAANWRLPAEVCVQFAQLSPQPLL